MISPDTKTNVKQEVKELYLITFQRSTFSKLEIQYKARLHFSFNLGCHIVC